MGYSVGEGRAPQTLGTPPSSRDTVKGAEVTLSSGTTSTVTLFFSPGGGRDPGGEVPWELGSWVPPSPSQT